MVVVPLSLFKARDAKYVWLDGIFQNGKVIDPQLIVYAGGPAAAAAVVTRLKEFKNTAKAANEGARGSPPGYERNKYFGLFHPYGEPEFNSKRLQGHFITLAPSYMYHYVTSGGAKDVFYGPYNGLEGSFVEVKPDALGRK